MNNTNIISACDRNLARLGKVANRLPDIINNTALLIVENPADLAGRSIRLLELLTGMSCRSKVRDFFDDYLPNDILEDKGKLTLGKKREGFEMPELDAKNLPFSYKSAEKAAKRIEKAKATKAEKANLAKLAQQDEAERIAQNDELSREVITLRNQYGDRLEEISRLKAEIDRLNAEVNRLTALIPESVQEQEPVKRRGRRTGTK